MLEGIKNKWDKIWKENNLRFFPEENLEHDFSNKKFILKLLYVPERANRTKKRKECPFDKDLKENQCYLSSFDGLALIANYRPIQKYHALLCSSEHMPQNDFNYEHILKITKIIEKTGLRSFLNLYGTAATINHFHTQVAIGSLNVESLEECVLNKNLSYLNYPGANLLISGSPEERCDLLYKKIEQLSKSDLPPTIKNDGTNCKTPLYNILFWENKIFFVPRSRETPVSINAMAGGLELSGTFVITKAIHQNNIFDGYSYNKLEHCLKEVTYRFDDAKFLYADCLK
jgi:hypothetical protein